jgi:putative tryptophan/tyrosine transport system substrate-binding protein
MRRREFIGLVGGAATWPVMAGAQQGAVRKIGFLGANTPAAAAHLATAFAKRLQQLGLNCQVPRTCCRTHCGQG